MFRNISKKIVSIALLLSLILGSIYYTSNTSSAEQSSTSNEFMELLTTTWTMTPQVSPIEANPNDSSIASNMWTTRDGKKVLRSKTETDKISPSIIHTPNLIRGKNSANYWLDYQNLLSWIEPTKNVEWKEVSSGYMKYFDWAFSGKEGTDEEWKVFKGEFELSESQLASLKSKKAKLLIAVPGETGPQMIYPLNDYASFFANEHNLGINFMTYQGGSHQKLFIKNGNEYNELNFKVANRLFVGLNQCKIDEHNKIMAESGVGTGSRIDGWHVHLDNSDESNTRNAMGEIPADYLQVGKNKLEILAGDNWTAGGVVKPEIYYYEDIPSINVVKRAYIKVDQKRIYLDENDKVAPGQRVYFEFDMANESNTRAVTDLSFVDNELGLNVTINKDSDYKNIEVYNSKDPSTNLGYGGLETLLKGETITVRCEDVLYYDTKESDRDKIITNTVTGNAKYFNNQLEAKDDASVQIAVKDKTYDVTIEKNIYKVNNKLIENNNEKKSYNNLHPGDKVVFEISMTNISKGQLNPDNSNSETIDLPIVGLSLTDILEVNNSTAYSKNEWKFTDSNGNEINLTNFGLKEKENKKVYTTWTVPSDGENINNILLDMNNGIKNTATLSQYGKKIKYSSVALDLGTWSIKLSKIVEDIDSLDENEKNRKFTLNLNGSDNKIYTVAAKHKDVYTIDNLTYGRTYTVNEIVPMNYTLTSITVDKDSVKDTNLNHSYKGKTVVFTNKRTNNNWFFDENRIENEFKLN